MPSLIHESIRQHLLAFSQLPGNTPTPMNNANEQCRKRNTSGGGNSAPADKHLYVPTHARTHPAHLAHERRLPL